MTFFGAVVSREFFLGLIAVWYFFGIRQILAGIKENKVGKKLHQDAREKLRSGIQPEEVVRQILVGPEGIDESIREVAERIMSGKDYKEAETSLCESKKMDTGNAVLLYNQTVGVISDVQKTVKMVGEEVRVYTPLENEKILTGFTGYTCLNPRL